MIRVRHLLAPSFASLTLLAACGDDGVVVEGEGTVAVVAYGEPFIEEGIPADVMEDGWAVSFGRFQITLADVSIAGTPVDAPAAIDLAVNTDGAGHPVGEALVPAGSYADGAFTIVRVEVEGSATLGATTKTFSWVFDEPVAYAGCETSTKVADGATTTFQITVHADHLFYDSLVAAEPALLFQAIADADTDADGAVTEAELAGTGLGAYDPGSESGIDDLWAFLEAQATTLGHVDGEGHCDATPAG